MRRERIALGVLALVIGALPFFVSTAYAFNVLNIIGLYAIVTLGLILLGCSGQVSLGQAAFYGLGAYASALLSRDLGWTPWITIPLAIAAVAGVAYLVGLPTLRLADHFFVLATVGFGIIVNVLMVQLLPVTGGGNGLRDIPALQVAGVRLATDRQFYYPIWALTFVTLILARNITSHRTGRALGNRTLIADAAESAFCAFTSGAALLGVGLNAGLGWWWADPVAALVIAALAVKEGLEAWEDEDEDNEPA